MAQQEVGYLLSLHGCRQQNTLQIIQFSDSKNNNLILRKLFLNKEHL